MSINLENDKQPHTAHPESQAGRVGTGNISGIATQTGTHAEDWLGGPQNGNEASSEAEKTLQEKLSSDISGPTGSGKYSDSEDRPPNEGVEVSDSLRMGSNGIESPSEAYGSGSASGFLSENAKNSKDASGWLGGPQNGDETLSESNTNGQRAISLDQPMPLDDLLISNKDCGMAFTLVPGGLVPATGESRDNKMIPEWLEDPRLGWFMSKLFQFTHSNDRYPNRLVVESVEGGILFRRGLV
ncbi:hypothetical protein AB4Y89_19925 [Terriglobus sp. 2YAB30_2]|uniref:hypothetical protein n=1 Tax=Terriglobus sp. 2YAB30_2 TaxID=3233023 RepID=UPI003F9C7226